jgi:hypothetical protein
MVIIVGTDRRKPAGPLATPAEAQALLTSLLAYAGTYTLDTGAHTVTHHIDVSWDETRTGESHLRTYRLEGDRLTLTSPPGIRRAAGRPCARWSGSGSGSRESSFAEAVTVFILPWRGAALPPTKHRRPIESCSRDSSRRSEWCLRCQ